MLLPKPVSPTIMISSSCDGGADTLSRPGRRGPFPTPGSGGDGRSFPRAVRSGAQDPETWSGDQVRLDIERVVDGGVGDQEPLG